MSFENIIGNQKIKGILDKTVESNSISHSYLFIGVEGIGKKLFAKEFAKKILCLNEKKENTPCDLCKSCIELANNNNPDFMIIDCEENSTSIKIDQIRFLNEKIVEKPIISNRKVYIINNADLMRIEAQNALLKTLEEPPEYATIILVATNESMLLNTIKSRCIKLHFSKISDEEIKNYIKANLNFEINRNMLSYLGGSIGKIYKLNENNEEYTKVEQIVNKLDNANLLDIFKQAEVLYKSKDIIQDLLEYMNILLSNTMQLNKIKCIDYVEEAKKRLNTNSNYDMTIDYLLMKIWEEINEEYSRS